MSDYESLKHLPEIAKVVTPVAAAIPFTGILKRMLGPAADEVAERFRDEVRIYRYGRQLECLKKAEKMAMDAGFTPKAVPIKILFPLLEGASLEEDETLHTMWAALLANASSDMAEIVRPSFISILKEMAPDEARLLSEVARKRDGLFSLPDYWVEFRFNVCLEGLAAAGLVVFKSAVSILLTSRGTLFLDAVSPPKAKP